MDDVDVRIRHLKSVGSIIEELETNSAVISTLVIAYEVPDGIGGTETKTTWAGNYNRAIGMATRAVNSFVNE